MALRSGAAAPLRSQPSNAFAGRLCCRARIAALRGRRLVYRSIGAGSTVARDLRDDLGLGIIRALGDLREARADTIAAGI